jgi:hypothetical protein
VTEHSSLSVVREVKSKGLRGAVHVSRIGRQEMLTEID